MTWGIDNRPIENTYDVSNQIDLLAKEFQNWKKRTKEVNWRTKEQKKK